MEDFVEAHLDDLCSTRCQGSMLHSYGVCCHVGYRGRPLLRNLLVRTGARILAINIAFGRRDGASTSYITDVVAGAQH